MLEGIRTPDPRLRRPLLYPAELWTHVFSNELSSHQLTLVKRVMGIEPTYLAWKASVLPLNYTRMRAIDGTRTRDPNLGKVVLHQLSHYRIYFVFADVSQRLV